MWFECFSQLSEKAASCESLRLESVARNVDRVGILTRCCHPSQHGSTPKVNSNMPLFHPAQKIFTLKQCILRKKKSICLCRLNWTAIPRRTIKVAIPARGFILFVYFQLLLLIWKMVWCWYWIHGFQHTDVLHIEIHSQVWMIFDSDTKLAEFNIHISYDWTCSHLVYETKNVL